MNSQRDLMVSMPSILLLVAIAIGIYNLPPSLDSLRPEMPPGPLPTEDVPARLWQDPLQAFWNLSEKDAAGRLQSPEKVLKGRLSKHTLILPVLIPGSSYSESHEVRLRLRYAVLTALYSVGYVPEEAEKIGVLAGKPPVAGSATTLPVPFEWHELEPSKSIGPSLQKFEQVLVLWVNDARLGDGFLEGLHSLLHELVDPFSVGDGQLSVEVIGPASSTGLLHYLVGGRGVTKDEAICEGFCPLKQAWLDSPLATAWNNNYDVFLLPYEMKLRHTIGMDRELCSLLKDELELRGVELSSDSQIILITEWDTYYGRSFPKSFRSAYPPEQSECIHEYTYLRGIDGQIPGAKREEHKGEGEDKANISGFLDAGQIERPEGRSQFDYLRRMVTQLERHRGKIRAIGVTGTDVYDKILILKALRSSFPDTLFFTTDLDVRLLHPSDYPATRNLLIASHFSLGLGEDSPGPEEGPPQVQTLEDRFAPSSISSPPPRYTPLFRYSYQSSIALSTLAALTPDKALRSSIPSRARLYEVGRSGAVLLNEKSLEDRQSPMWALALLLASITLSLWRPDMRELRRDLTEEEEEPKKGRLKKVGSLLAHKMTHISSLYLGWLLLRLAPFAVLAWMAWADSHSRNGERWSLFGGISIWPTQFLLLLIVMLAIEFVLKVLRDFETVKLTLDRKFFHVSPEGWQRGELEWTITGSIAQRLRFCWEEFKPQALRELRLLGTFSRATLKNPVHQWSRSDVLKLWEDYCARTSPGALAGRMLLYGLLVLPVTAAIFYWAPQRPFRGPLTHWVDLVLLASTLLAIAFLLVQVWDVTFFTSRFVRKLAGRESQWPKATIKAYTSSDVQERYPGELVNEWLDINFIARHTEAVGRFIYLPFILLLLYAAAHHPVLDNWVIRPREILIFLAAMALAVTPLVAVRRAAEAARRRARDRLRVKSMHAQGSKDSGPRLSVLQRCLSDIDSIKSGAFSPLTENPLLRAALIPFGGIGGMALLDFLLT